MSTAPIDYPPRLLEAAAFLKEHDPAVAEWPPGRYLEWFDCLWRKGCVGVVRQNGSVCAVAVARCVGDIEDALCDNYLHHEDPVAGPFLWVDQIASAHPLGLSHLMAQARKRFGPRTDVGGQVFNRNGQLRKLPWQRVNQLFSSHGLT